MRKNFWRSIRFHPIYGILILISLVTTSLFFLSPSSLTPTRGASNYYDNTNNSDFNWSDNKTDISDSFVVNAPADSRDYYAGQINMSFLNVRKERTLIAVENEFTGAALNLPHGGFLAMSVNLTVRTKIFGIKTLLFGEGGGIAGYNLGILIFRANTSNNLLPEEEPYWIVNKTVSTDDSYFGLHDLKFTEESGSSHPLTLQSGIWYIGLQHNPTLVNEFLFWGFFHDEPTYPTDANTDSDDEGWAMEYNVTSDWQLINTHARYGDRSQTDVTIDFVLFIDAEEYILPTSSFLTINSTLITDLFTGFGEITLDEPVLPQDNLTYYFSLYTRINVVFDVIIHFSFRNIVIKLESSLEDFHANEEIYMTVETVNYPTNDPMGGVPIKISQDGRLIETVQTDSQGRAKISISFPESGNYLIGFAFGGDDLGNTKGELIFEVTVLPAIPPLITPLTILSFLITLFLIGVLSIFSWRFYFGGWTTPMPYQVYCIYKTGLNIVERKYSGKSEADIDAQLISGLLSAIASFSEVLAIDPTVKDNLRSIEKGHLTMPIEWGRYITLTCVVKNDSLNLRRKLRMLLIEFEEKYEDELVDWIGDISPFDNAYLMIDKYFLPTSIDSSTLA